jgi:glucose/arabinose dehydrogenase
VLALGLAACSDDGGAEATQFPRDTDESTTAPATGELAVTDVATNLDTVWSLAWDDDGKLWYTERGGRLTQMGGRSTSVAGVAENGEAGLMGLEFGPDGATYLMYSGARDNRIVRLAGDDSQEVLVDGIEAAGVHNGGRLRLGPDNALYAGTGDAGDGDSAQRSGRNGKILRVDLGGGRVDVFSTGHRNPQGLCFHRDRTLYITEHGPDRGDEINRVERGDDGGWPDDVGNGIKNYTPTIAPAGCTFYDADLIPQWKGSLLFVTLKDQSLRRLTFDADGAVADEEVLYQGDFGRLRDVAVGPDGAVYLATSNRDGRGSPNSGDDRILRIAPAG